jgi:hypothetical protein
MKSLEPQISEKKMGEMKEHGRIIAQAIQRQKVDKEKNMMKAVKRRETMLENAAEKALSGH